MYVILPTYLSVCLSTFLSSCLSVFLNIFHSVFRSVFSQSLFLCLTSTIFTPLAMPLHDPKDLLSLVPVSYGLVDAVPASPSSWNVFFVDHFCAITFMENPPKIIAQYPCLRLRLTCHLSLSLASRIRSPLFPISVRASRQRREDSGDSSKSTEALISLALQLDGLDLFYLQRRDEALDGRLLLDKPGTEAVVSAWDLFFSTVHFALRFRTLGRRTFEDVSIELVSLPGRDFYDDKEFLALHL